MCHRAVGDFEDFGSTATNTFKVMTAAAPDATFIDWASNQLSILLGLDDETLRSDFIPYLLTFKTPIELRGHLVDILGTAGQAGNFIQTFIDGRFAKNQRSKKPVSAPIASPAREVVKSDPQHNIANAFGNPAQVYIKKQTEDDYFVGKKSTSKNSSPVHSATPSRTASPAPNAPSQPSINQSANPSSSYLVSEKLGKKKAQVADVSETHLETTLRKLDLTSAEDVKTREKRHCECQATRHPLLTIAPNCLNCGKIICEFEGPGPCTFCGSPVISREQQLRLLGELKAQRSVEKQRRNEAAQRKGKSASSGRSTPYAAKIGGSSGIQYHAANPVLGQEQQRNAEAHAARLLDFDRTSAKRTTVIDQATAFDLPSDGGDKWLSPQDRADQMKRQQNNLAKLTQQKSEKRRVMTLNLDSKTVSMQEVGLESDEDSGPVRQPKDSGIVKSLVPTGDKNRESAPVGTYSQNPHLRKLARPIYVKTEQPSTSEQTTKLKTKAPRLQKSRLQYDDGVGVGLALAGV